MKLKSNTLSKIKISGYGSRLRPQRDWLFLLGAAVVLLTLGVFWHTWLFSKVTSGEGGESDTAQQEVRATELDAVRGLFDKRRAEEERYLSEYRFIDPATRGR
ncbi:MAG TPA: hypothetical protein VF696_02645 [Candidatus Paceibacterota bacterium]|jgi:hypothetical protein